MNLHPYNLYILLAAFILLIIFVIILAVKAASLIKKIAGIKPVIDSIQTNGKIVKEVSRAVLDKTKLDLKTGIGIVSGIAVFKAIRKDYKESGNTGMKQVEKSTVNVMEERRKKKMLKDFIAAYAGNRKIA